MRHVLIVSPNLTHFQPGDVLSGEELGMDDDQLDALVSRGYAVNHDTGEEAPAEAEAPVEETVEAPVEPVEAKPSRRPRASADDE